MTLNKKAEVIPFGEYKGEAAVKSKQPRAVNATLLVVGLAADMGTGPRNTKRGIHVSQPKKTEVK